MFSLRDSFPSILGSMAIIGFLFLLSTLAFAASTSDTIITVSGLSIQKITSITVTDITSDSANIGWEKSDGSRGYIAYYDTKPSVDNKYKYYSPIVAGTGTSLKNLTPNTTYYLVIKTFDKDANEIVISDEIKFSTLSGDTNTATSSDLTKDGNSLQNPSIITTNSSSPSIERDSTENKIISNTNVIKNNVTGSNVNQIVIDTKQIKKLPKTGPISSIIVVLSLMISFILIIFLRKRDLI